MSDPSSTSALDDAPTDQREVNRLEPYDALCWSPSAARSGPRRWCRSWRTSPAAGASPGSGSPRSASTTTCSAAAARSTISAARFSTALREDLDGARPRPAVYWGNRNWAPFLDDEMRAIEAAGPPAGARRDDERLLVVLLLPAVPREPLRRDPASSTLEVDRLRHYANHPGFVAPPSTPRCSARPARRAGVRGAAGLRHPLDPDVDGRHRRAAAARPAAPTSAGTARSPPR